MSNPIPVQATTEERVSYDYGLLSLSHDHAIEYGLHKCLLSVNLRPCDCEYASHFDDGPGHPYGRVAYTIEVSTAYGTFNWCRQCVLDHYYPEPEVQK